MIRLNEKLLLLPTNEVVQGSVGFSLDVLYQHTFSAWVQFLDLGKVRSVNLGVLAQWEDETFVERVKVEDRARRVFQTQVEVFAKQKDNYYFITTDIINKTLDILERQDYYYFDYYCKASFLVSGQALLQKDYYGQFINNMFGIPIHYARQSGQSYYFVQEVDTFVIVPNIVTLEHSEAILDSWVQKLNLPKTVLWQNFRKYVRSTFGVKIEYGKPEPKQKAAYASKWRGGRK